MNIYLGLILFFLIAGYLIDLIAELLNIRNISYEIPQEFIGVYDEARYKKSQDYLKDTTHFKLLKSGVMLGLILILILIGGFNILDQFCRSFGLGSIITGLIFFLFLGLASFILNLPFDIYHTFILEEKYGFNKTTPKTFVLDLIKSIFLLIIIGGVVSGVILWFFQTFDNSAWWMCWIFVTLFQLFMLFITPVLILPLFYKFTNLDDGELKQAIATYAQKQNFKLKGIFTMDGSRRSTKTNAFFTGLGKNRRVVLFDTLIAKNTVDELVSIVGHEVGHYKKRHIYKNLLISVLNTGFMFYLLDIFLNNAGLFSAFKMEQVSIWASLVFFGFLYSPIELFIGIICNYFSRKFEYEADAFAVNTTKNANAFVSALRKLTVDNLSNLNPHWFYVILDYSHPPMLKRIRRFK